MVNFFLQSKADLKVFHYLRLVVLRWRNNLTDHTIYPWLRKSTDEFVVIRKLDRPRFELGSLIPFLAMKPITLSGRQSSRVKYLQHLFGSFSYLSRFGVI